MRFDHTNPDEHFSDVGGGMVLRSAPGYPSFPPRLAVEIFERARLLIDCERVGVWDPMCGAGGLLTAIGLMRTQRVTHLLGTDVASDALQLASRNLALVDPDQLARQREWLIAHEASSERVEAASRLLARLTSEAVHPTVATSVADITDQVATRSLDLRGISLAITDLPYGRQVSWVGPPVPVRLAFDVVMGALPSGGAFALSTIERAEIAQLPSATRSFKHGHRHIRIYRNP